MLPDWSVDFEVLPKPSAPLGFGPFGQAPRPPIPANDQGSTLTRAVSEDFEAIFAEASPRVEAFGPPRRVTSMSPAKRGPAPPSKRGRLLAWAAVAVAAAAGVGIGALVFREPPKAPSPPPTVSSTAPVPSSAELRTPQIELPASAPPVAKAKSRTKPAPAAEKPKAAKAKARTSGPAPSRSAVMAADRELRDAYADARRAGVDRDRLVAVNRRWVALRNAPPAKLVPGYTALAQELRAQAAKAHPRKHRLFG